MEIRRVVTGHDADGKAIVVDDELVEPVVLDALARERVPSTVGSRFDSHVSRRRVTARAKSYFPP